jgi:hypothetical protein
MSIESEVTGLMRPANGGAFSSRSIARRSASSHASPDRTWTGQTGS